MTGRFSIIDDRRCRFYARFMSGLTLPQANGLYWGLFMFVLFLMCVVANIHQRSMTLASEVKTKRDEERARRIRKHFLGLVTILWCIASACIVLEVFALLNIQYCDGEDLIVLYWSFWGFLQVGSTMAIFGVILNLWITIADVHTPSWAVALGTPVLVFAALHWILQAVWRQAWVKFTGRDIEGKDRNEIDEEEEQGRLNDEEESEKDKWISTAPTIAPNQPEQLLVTVFSRRSSI